MDKQSHIRPYEDKDFDKVFSITKSLWSGEVDMSEQLNEFIYRFLVKNYLFDSGLNYVYVDDDVVAFALASNKKDVNDSLSFFNENIDKLSPNDQIKAKDYLEYINYNHDVLAPFVNEDDVYFNLLASVEKGAGSKLIANLKEAAKERKKKHLYFWTDETCDYEYYERKGFIKIKEYVVYLFGKSIKTFIYKIDL